MADSTAPRYGDFPELFQTFPRDQAVDLEDLRTQMVLMARADRATMRRLYPPDEDEARRRRQAAAEAAELADRLLGPQSSHPGIPDSPAKR